MQSSAHRRDRVGDVAFGPRRWSLRIDHLRERQVFRTEWCNKVVRGNPLPLGDQESVGRDAQRGVVMEAAPASSFEMSEPDLLFEFLIIALDTPTQFGEVHQLAEGDVFRQGRKPIFGWLFLTFE